MKPKMSDDIMKVMHQNQEALFKALSEGMCGCISCIDRNGYIPYHMVVCPKCGNKRCPKASNCAMICTSSNEPGQPGSVYT